MIIRGQPLAEVTRRAIEVLTRELGSADTLRFVNQFTTGFGDYTAERDRLIGDETLDDIIGAIKSKRNSKSSDSISPKRTKTRGKKEG